MLLIPRMRLTLALAGPRSALVWVCFLNMPVLLCSCASLPPSPPSPPAASSLLSREGCIRSILCREEMEETLLAIAGPKKRKEVQDLLAAEIDGEDDFDAADHERRMERLFDDNFYGEDDDESKHPFEGQEMSCAGIDDVGLPLTQSWRPKMGENEFGKCMSQSILKPQRQEVCSARRRRYEQRALGRGGAGGMKAGGGSLSSGTVSGSKEKKSRRNLRSGDTAAASLSQGARRNSSSCFRRGRTRSSNSISSSKGFKGRPKKWSCQVEGCARAGVYVSIPACLLEKESESKGVTGSTFPVPSLLSNCITSTGSTINASINSNTKNTTNSFTSSISITNLSTQTTVAQSFSHAARDVWGGPGWGGEGCVGGRGGGATDIDQLRTTCSQNLLHARCVKHKKAGDVGNFFLWKFVS